MSPALLCGIVIVIAIILFIINKLPLGATATICALLCVLFGLLKPNALFSNYASTSVVLMCGMMIVGGGMYHTGLAAWLGKRIAQPAKGRELPLQIAVMVLAMALSMFCSANAAIMTLYPIICAIGLAAHVSMTKLIHPLWIGCIFGNWLTLSACNMTPAVSQLLEDGGYGALGYFEIAPFGIARIVVSIFVLYFITRKLLPERYVAGNKEEADKVTDFPKEFTPKMGISLAILILTVIGLIINNKACPTYICAAIGAMLTVITGCVNQKQMYNSIAWNAVFMMGGMTAVASCMNSSGLAQAIADWTVKIIGTNTSPVIVVLLIYTASTLTSQFMSNTADATMFGTLGIAIAATMGVDPRAFAIAGLVGSGAMHATPASNSLVGFFIEAGGYSMKEWARLELFQFIIGLIACLIIPLVWL